MPRNSFSNAFSKNSLKSDHDKTMVHGGLFQRRFKRSKKSLCPHITEVFWHDYGVYGCLEAVEVDLSKKGSLHERMFLPWYQFFLKKYGLLFGMCCSGTHARQTIKLFLIKKLIKCLKVACCCLIEKQFFLIRQINYLYLLWLY